MADVDHPSLGGVFGAELRASSVVSSLLNEKKSRNQFPSLRPQRKTSARIIATTRMNDDDHTMSGRNYLLLDGSTIPTSRRVGHARTYVLCGGSVDHLVVLDTHEAAAIHLLRYTCTVYRIRWMPGATCMLIALLRRNVEYVSPTTVLRVQNS